MHKINLPIFLGMVSMASAQKAIDFFDVYSSPQSYLGQRIIFSRILAGEMQDGGGDFTPGYGFFLRLQDDAGNSVHTVGSRFTPVLSPQLAIQWRGVGAMPSTLLRSNIHGRLFQSGRWVLLEIIRIEILDTADGLPRVIE